MMILKYMCLDWSGYVWGLAVARAGHDSAAEVLAARAGRLPVVAVDDDGEQEQKGQEEQGQEKEDRTTPPVALRGTLIEPSPSH